MHSFLEQESLKNISFKAIFLHNALLSTPINLFSLLYLYKPPLKKTLDQRFSCDNLAKNRNGGKEKKYDSIYKYKIMSTTQRIIKIETLP